MNDSIEETDETKLAKAEPRNSYLTGRENYNVVSDMVTGVNVRRADNILQAIAIFVCLLIGAGVGAVAFEERILGALGGAFVGVLTGLLGSGLFLMVFRAIRHMRGRHD